VHGVELAFHDAPTTETPEVDGHVIRRQGPIGLVYTADCLPVAVAGPGGVAMLHCGWRGLAAGIVSRGSEAVGATHAAIGPGIGPCCYEVGDEVLAAFADLGDGVADGNMLDLPEVARRLLRRAGVERIESEETCTRCEPELFFSHRRDGGPGRQAGLAWIDAGEE
jgi:YfiH family protein